MCLYVYGSVFEKLILNTEIGNLLGNLDYRCETKVYLMAEVFKCERRSEGRCMRDIQ